MIGGKAAAQTYLHADTLLVCLMFPFQLKESSMSTLSANIEPWNKGILVGQKPPLKLKEIWAIRVRLQLGARHRDLALFNLAIYSKLRGCDLVKPKIKDVTNGRAVMSRAIVMQQKTGRPVQLEITENTRDAAISNWMVQLTKG